MSAPTREQRVKDNLLTISIKAIALFDSIDEHGIDAPWNDPDCLRLMVEMLDAAEAFRSFFQRLSASRLIALGVNPADVVKMTEATS